MKNTKVIAAIAVFIIAALSVSLYSVTGEGKQEKEKRIIVGQPLSAVITSSESGITLAVMIRTGEECQLYVAYNGWFTTQEDLTKACCIIQGEINDNSDEEKQVRLTLNDSGMIIGVTANNVSHSWR